MKWRVPSYRMELDEVSSSPQLVLYSLIALRRLTNDWIRPADRSSRQRRASHLMNSQSLTTHVHCEKSYQLSVTKWCFQSTWQLCLRCVWEQFIYFTWNLSGIHYIYQEYLKGGLPVCSSVSWWWLLTAWGIGNIINLYWYCTLQLQECGYWKRTIESRTIFQICSAWHNLETNYIVHRNVQLHT